MKRLNFNGSMNNVVIRNLGDLTSMVNNNTDATIRHFKEITEAVNHLSKKVSKTRLNLALTTIAGIIYVIKNEYDKDEMQKRLIELDKAAIAVEEIKPK